VTYAVIVAAGKSERMGAGTDKAFLSLVNKPVVAWSLLAFERCRDIDKIVLVVRKTQLEAAKAVAKMFGISKLCAIVQGGARRQDSVKAGLDACGPFAKLAVVHDGARPLVKPEMISEVVEAARKHGAVAIGRRVVDTIKRVSRAPAVEKTEDRAALWAVQTPQAFQIKTIVDAYSALGKQTATDDCQAVELAGGKTRIVECNLPNFKITTVEDLQLAGAMLK